jgi:SAM-dependent methyltransferase
MSIYNDICSQFSGGWSYTQKEIQELFKYLNFKETYSILEFGSGDSTIKLYNYIKKYVNNLIFYTYESDSNYIIENTEINYILYDINNIQDVVIPDIQFDLILIDGPNGDKRSLWYSKIRNNVKKGTIILIDDFNHYKCFSDELDKNFEYELLSFNNEPFVPNGEHSWKIVKVIDVKIRNEIIDFRFLTIDDEYDLKYEWWSRIYEYKYVLNMISMLGATPTSFIHNTSWGFQGCHLSFKNDIDNKYINALHSDIKESYIKNTFLYDITKPISKEFHNYFDFVLNVSTIEEVNYPTNEILDNLLQQVKPNGYLIITFDYDRNNCNLFGNGSMNLSLVENYINKSIEKIPENAINGKNVLLPLIQYQNLNCGVLVIQKK